MRMSDSEMKVCNAVKAAMMTARPRRSIKELAASMGTTYDVLSNIANARTRPDEQILAALRKELSLPADWPSENPRLDGVDKGQKVSLAGTPLYDLRIVGAGSAGPGRWNVDVDYRTVSVPQRLKDLCDFGWIVEGDSMMPLLYEFDTAAFKEMRKPRTGLTYLIRMPDEQQKIKLLLFDRGEWHMESLNRKYKRERLPDGAQLEGILVGYYRVQGTREVMDSDPEGLRPEPHMLPSFSGSESE